MAELTSINPPPSVLGGGRIEVVFGGGYLQNQSGIGNSLAKLLQMPGGWDEYDGYKEHFRPDDTQVERFFHGPWGTRKQFYDWALGYSYSIPDPNNPAAGKLKRVPPAQEPEFPWMYCVDAELVRGEGAWINNPHVLARDRDGALIRINPDKDLDGFPIPGTGRTVQIPKIGYVDSGTGRDSQSALVKLTYRNLNWEIRTDEETDLLAFGELSRNIYRQKSYAMEAIGLPSGTLKFTEGPVQGTEVAENAQRLLIPKNSWKYHWMDVPDVPESAIAECVGKVNAYDFDMGVFGAPYHLAETLLCLPPITERYRTPVGRVSWKIIYQFLVSPSTKGWNAYPAVSTAGAGDYYLAAINGDPQKYAFKTADFGTLFQMPAPVVYQ